jgi:hypothetical protein
MASRVDIANLALTKLGSASKITSRTDNSVAAIAINSVYEMVRLAELRRYYWAFALKRAALPLSAMAPTWGFSAAYPLPSDFVRLVQVNEFYLVPGLYDYNTADASAFSIETNADGVLSILCNYEAPLKVRYVWNATDEGTFDALFNMSFASKLAYETCEQITGSTGKREQAKADYREAIAMAIKVGAIEKPPALIGDDSWMMARL